MKSFLIKLSVAIIPSVFLLSSVASAALTSGPVSANPKGIVNPIKVNTIQELVTQLLTVMIDLAVIVSVLFFIFAGLKMVMARGDPEGIKDAKGMIWYTAIGACVALGAKSIQLVIQNTVDQLK